MYDHTDNGAMRRLALTGLILIALVGFPAVGQGQGFKDVELVEAAKSGAIIDARAAILLGQSPNIRARDGTPVIVVAAESANLPVLQFLLENSAKPDLYDRQTGKTALIAAAEIGHAGLVHVLLTHDADPNLPDRRGETPLMKAARSGSQEVVRMLLDAGADAGATDYAGRKALWHARDARDRRITKLIEEAGGR